jgi:hypothetical protein
MDMRSRFPGYYKAMAVWIERLLALVTLAGVFVFGLGSTQTFVAMDWRLTETFYELIYLVLLLVIAVELVRTLVTHDLRPLVELLAFVIARKMLKSDVAVLDILLSVLAFVALLGANRFWLSTPLPQESERPTNTT